MTNPEVFSLCAGVDNYIHCLRTNNSIIVVDPGEAGPVLDSLAASGLVLTDILITHHHNDHTAGVQTLHTRTACRVWGSHDNKMPFVNNVLNGECEFICNELRIQAIPVPGHTADHLAYYVPDSSTLFSGDTLFAAGCGRVFEGTMEEMYASLQKLSALPDDTRVYCGHEYTKDNLRFAVSIEPGNPEVAERLRHCTALRTSGTSTVPFLLKDERTTNPFLRCADTQFANTVGCKGMSPAEVFSELRKRKDRF